jgi:hypothetical protein
VKGEYSDRDIDLEQGVRPFRYERKFFVNHLSLKQVQAILKLHPAMLQRPYPPRFVNNLYFDTLDMSNYHDNINGAVRRWKVRIRWYGELFGKIAEPILEFKIKEGFIGTKRSYKLASFQLDKDISGRYLQQVFTDSKLPNRVRISLGNQFVVLCNRYYRWYYATHDGIYRVTLDDQLIFYPVKANRNNFANHKVNHRERIVELKYDRSFDMGAERLAGYFPFRVTKSSKYVQGIESVYF